jgi:hypothetical protein
MPCQGAKNRIVPINDKLATVVADWRAITGDGYVARSLTKGDRLGDSLSVIGISTLCGRPEYRLLK